MRRGGATPSGPALSDGPRLGPAAPSGGRAVRPTCGRDRGHARSVATALAGGRRSLAVIALGAADGEIEKAGADLQAAARRPGPAEDVGAPADGLAKDDRLADAEQSTGSRSTPARSRPR